ncbi:MAG: tRNA preQ1(34) S-adenosylmethionine ribosyltransferase-isomerase QueA [Deltaproteobacteria bacterium]|nr:tRNA preQ1(34) S-adenosylmethionine ribosyltransferase-isomerase QueA [Deltaproteobacteria bacterium]
MDAISLYDFELPAELIARHPLAERDASRLLLVERSSGRIEARSFRELPELLSPPDVLVVNESKVIPARVFGRKRGSMGRCDLLLVQPIEGDPCRFLAMATSARSLRPGSLVDVDGGRASVRVDRAGGEGFVEVTLPEPFEAFLSKHGEVPLPPYLGRAAEPEDAERYQTVYADPRKPGSVAAPTAGLHFSHGVLGTLAARGIQRLPLTLHVGPGTFLPVRVERLDDHAMHEERYEIPESTVSAILSARASGGRVVAVGTTVVRALESSVPLRPGPGETRIFIRPGHTLQNVDALVTNFHLPKSTLAVLVAAVLGLDLFKEAYARAVRERFRFFSYGDAMVIL